MPNQIVWQPASARRAAEILVHHFDSRIDRERQAYALLVDLEEGAHEFQIGQEQLVPEFEIADVVLVAQAFEFGHHGLGLVLAQKGLLALPAFEERRIAAIGATIRTAAAGHDRQHELAFRSENRGIYAFEAAVAREDFVIRERQRGKIAVLVRFGAEDLAVDQFFPHAVGGAEFSAQMPHHVADGVFAIADTDVIDVRIGDGLFLGQHGPGSRRSGSAAKASDA